MTSGALEGHTIAGGKLTILQDHGGDLGTVLQGKGYLSENHANAIRRKAESVGSGAELAEAPQRGAPAPPEGAGEEHHRRHHGAHCTPARLGNSLHVVAGHDAANH